MKTSTEKSRAAAYAHSFLCGHLVANHPLFATDPLFRDWQSQAVSEKSYKVSCLYYYESFVDSILPRESPSGQKQPTLGHYVKEVNAACTIELSSGSYTFRFERIHLFLFPLNIILFAIEIDESGADLNNLTEAHGRLRDVNRYAEMKAQGYLKALQPLLDLCGAEKQDYTCLTDTGNKLKIFQTIECEQVTDELLYEVGTLSKIGCVSDLSDRNTPSEEYKNHVLTTYKVSIYHNWSALALFDTMTLLARQLSESDRWTWSMSYFRMIYVHLLYQKTLLFYFNRRFRMADTDTEELLYDIREQEHYYGFSNISYNFLPQTLYEAIDRGMGMEIERKALHGHIEQVGQIRRQVSERKLNRIILLLTFLTLTSTLYDGTSLLTEMLGIDAGTCAYVRVALLLILCAALAVVAVWVLNRFKKV